MLERESCPDDGGTPIQLGNCKACCLLVSYRGAGGGAAIIRAESLAMSRSMESKSSVVALPSRRSKPVCGMAAASELVVICPPMWRNAGFDKGGYVGS